MKVHQWARWARTQRWHWRDTYALGAIGHLQQLTRELGVALPRLYGHHFLFNNPTNSDVGSDWYDNYQAPRAGGAQLYARRMWVGGSVAYDRVPRENDIVDCAEGIKAVRALGSNVFVTIERVYTVAGQPSMRETRTLLYTNDPFEQRDTAAAGAAADSLAVSAQQQLRFSMLSYNLHKIHYDAAYARLEHLPRPLVLGPFLAVLMIQYFAQQHPATPVRSFTYRNSAPMYVDSTAPISCTAVAQGWEVRVGNHCTGVVS